MIKVEFSKEELDAAIIQVGARLDALKEIQKEEGKKENIKRVIEMEEFMKPIRSFYDKIFNARFK